VTGWNEVADGVFQRRYDPLDISICVVRGADGLLLVDTRSSPRQADEIRADLRELGDAPVLAVVNTHAHFDHTFGNQRFTAAPLYGHRLVPDHLEAFERHLLAAWVALGDEAAQEWAEVRITPPSVLVGDGHRLDVGGRSVDLLHLGRGHTDNDLVVHVPDAGAWLVGDLVEESGPPMYGSGCFPLEWPETNLALVERVGAADVVVPGHGKPVTRDFVTEQQAQIEAVAGLIRELHRTGVPEAQAVAAGGGRWALPPEGLTTAIAQGYAQLGEPH
jgi:glyoxylase-like metal-dependent hydrolase (beta-lactamase superfamily II)